MSGVDFVNPVHLKLVLRVTSGVMTSPFKYFWTVSISLSLGHALLDISGWIEHLCLNAEGSGSKKIEMLPIYHYIVLYQKDHELGSLYLRSEDVV